MAEKHRQVNCNFLITYPFDRKVSREGITAELALTRMAQSMFFIYTMAGTGAMLEYHGLDARKAHQI